MATCFLVVLPKKNKNPLTIYYSYQFRRCYCDRISETPCLYEIIRGSYSIH